VTSVEAPESEGQFEHVCASHNEASGAQSQGAPSQAPQDLFHLAGLLHLRLPEVEELRKIVGSCSVGHAPDSKAFRAVILELPQPATESSEA